MVSIGLIIISKEEWLTYPLRKAHCVTACRICGEPILFNDLYRDGKGYMKRAHEKCIKELKS